MKYLITFIFNEKWTINKEKFELLITRCLSKSKKEKYYF